MSASPLLHLPLLHDAGLLRTNPVYVMEQVARAIFAAFPLDWEEASRRLGLAVDALSTDGRPLPTFVVEDFVRRGWLPHRPAHRTPMPDPRVQGLVVNLDTDVGFVVPLHFVPALESWNVDVSLPFTAAQLQDLLARVLASTELPLDGAVPERLALAVHNPLGHRCQGNSMLIAALLAVLDAVGDRTNPRLRAACCVVEPAGGNALKPVCGVHAKLTAFRREIGRGSLLVCAEATSFADDFDEVWETTDLRDLARRLESAGLLKPLLDASPLTRREMERAHDLLRRRTRVLHHYHDALDLASRLRRCRTAETIPEGLRRGIDQLHAELRRHLGDFGEAEEASRRILDQERERGEYGSDDELADAAAEHASALFDCHRFGQIPDVLEPWIRMSKEDPRRLQFTTRIKLNNTLARALIVLSRPGWEELLSASRRLQQRLDPAGEVRTRCYLVHGLLRHGRCEEATEELDRLTPFEQHQDFSCWMLKYLRADLARRRGETWDDPHMDERTPDAEGPGHPFAFYFQATARQRGRRDAGRRLRLAAEFLRKEARGHERNLSALLAWAVELMAAAIDGDEVARRRAVEALNTLPAQDACLMGHYGEVLRALEQSSDVAEAERLLQLTPYL